MTVIIYTSSTEGVLVHTDVLDFEIRDWDGSLVVETRGLQHETRDWVKFEVLR